MSALDVTNDALKTFIRSESRRDEAASDIVAGLESAGHLWEEGWVQTVEVHHARVIVETIEAYGLVIQLDAHGNAVTVNSPHGFMVIE